MFNLKRFFLSLCMLGLVAIAGADAPAGYYSAAEGLRGDALESALRNIIDGHNSLSYNGAKDELWEIVEPENGVITCVYTGRTTTNLSRDTDGMNTEHTWPQSRGAGSTPPRSDLHHLFVTDSGWNSTRGSLRFNNVNSPSSTSDIGAKVNTSEGFEPPDEYKGDIARAIFYFAVRYDEEVRNNAVMGGSNSSTSDDHMGELDVLIQWHFDDPPSQHEQNRNDRIYGIQRNRNPFIDNPDFINDWFELGPPVPAVASTTLPIVPDFAAPTSIRATINSTISIDSNSVSTFWRVGSAGGFNELPMSLVSGNASNGIWQTDSTIPQQSGETRIEYYVEASDTDGTMGRDPESGQKFFIVEGPAPPAITLTTIPATPRYDETTTFQAAITAELGVATDGAILSYRMGNTGAFTELPLTLQSGSTTNGTWATTSLPAMVGGTVIQYFAVATDTAGTMTRQPLSGTAAFTVFEPSAPVVVAEVSPAAPRIGEAINIVADVTSEEGIDATKVIAVYTTSDGRNGELAMSLTSGNVNDGSWQASEGIEGLEIGDELSYAVAVEDTEGRMARDPDVGFKTVTVTDIPQEIDVAGYVLTDTNASLAVTFPSGTVIPANGFLIVARDVSKTEFESLYGSLPENAVFLNSFDLIGGNGLVINGSEIFTLEDAEGTLIDGPTPGDVDAKNARAYRTATNANTWAEGAANDASPGILEVPGTGAGLIITEFSDPADSYKEAFVEIYYDAPAPVVVNFEASVSEGEAPLSVTFTDTTTGPTPTDYQWDFDNNGVVDSTSANPTHVYTVPGVYTVRMTNSAGTRTKNSLLNVTGVGNLILIY